MKKNSFLKLYILIGVLSMEVNRNIDEEKYQYHELKINFFVFISPPIADWHMQK